MRNSPNLAAGISSVLLVTALAATPARAAEPQRCGTIVDDNARLACYDAVFGTPTKSAVAAPDATGTAAAATPALTSAPVAAAAPVSSAPPAAVGAGVAAGTVAAGAAQAVDPAQNFGFDGAPPEQKKAEKPEKPKETESISSVIKSVNKRLLGELTVELENGQVWTQLEPDPSVLLRAGDPVTISKGVLGSYKLVSGPNVTKVKRVK